MAYISINGQTGVTANLDSGGKNSVPFQPTIYMSGSQACTDVPNLSGSLVALNTGSCADIRMIVVRNPSSSSILVTSDAAGTKPVTYVWPNDTTMVTWSGSNAFWAKSLGSPINNAYFLFIES